MRARADSDRAALHNEQVPGATGVRLHGLMSSRTCRWCPMSISMSYDRGRWRACDVHMHVIRLGGGVSRMACMEMDAARLRPWSADGDSDSGEGVPPWWQASCYMPYDSFGFRTAHASTVLGDVCSCHGRTFSKLCRVPVDGAHCDTDRVLRTGLQGQDVERHRRPATKP